MLKLKKSSLTLKAPQLRNLTEENFSEASKIERNNIWVALDRVYDTYNIGTAARLIEGINGRGIILVGDITADQAEKQVKKSSVFTSELIEWRKIDQLCELDDIFTELPMLVAVEKLEDEDLKRDLHVQLNLECKTHTLKGRVQRALSKNIPIVVVVGNETTGIVDIDFLYETEFIIEIPVLGINNSMNVTHALAVALYKMIGF